MEAKVLQNIFLEILRSELTETEPDNSAKDKLTPEVISELYDLSKKQDLVHIVASFLYKNKLITDDEILKKYNQEEMVSVYRIELMKHAYKEICDAFNEVSIPYIPLKGSVIRPYYPKESMRTSCDIDILVKEENLNKAIESLVKKGFICGERNYHDVSLYSPTKIHLELHFNIQENIDNLDNILKDAWEYSTLVKDSQYKFTNEFFMFHMYAHMSYHFLSGGCGIKPLMDIWVIKNKMGIDYTKAKELLEKAKIYQFAKEIDKLSDICFSDKPKDEFSDILLLYIFDGGVYGTVKNRISVKRTESSNVMVYALKRLFVPYKKMIVIYPTLSKVPVLLPIFWIVRFFEMLFLGKTKRAIAEVKTVNDISDNKIDIMKQMRNRLGL